MFVGEVVDDDDGERSGQKEKRQARTAVGVFPSGRSGMLRVRDLAPVIGRRDNFRFGGYEERRNTGMAS